MKRIAQSLAILPASVASGGGCPYAALFAAVAKLAQSSPPLCPQWLPSVSTPTADAGFGSYVIEFHGDQAGLPHLVFAWTRSGSPPGRLTATTSLGRDDRIPVYFNTSQAATLFADHYTAVISRGGADVRFWVSWHLYYNERAKDLSTLLHVVRSLTLVRP